MTEACYTREWVCSYLNVSGHTREIYIPFVLLHVHTTHTHTHTCMRTHTRIENRAPTQKERGERATGGVGEKENGEQPDKDAQSEREFERETRV